MKHLISTLFLCVLPSIVWAQTENQISENQANPENALSSKIPEEQTRLIPVNGATDKTTFLNDGSKVTVREIQPIVLSKPSKDTIPLEIGDELRESIEEHQEENTHQKVIGIGASVYRLENNETRSLVQIWGLDGNTSVSFWSKCDFSLFSGIGEFKDPQGNSYVLFMVWGFHEGIVSEKELLEISGENKTVNLAELGSNKASYIIHEGKPSDDVRASIDSLHEYLNLNQEKLRIFQEERQRVAREREEYLKANPPPAKTLTLSHWRIHKTTSEDEQEGGDQ